jgi:hypothetical protein
MGIPVRANATTALGSLKIAQNVGTITGTIVNESGSPLSGATVVLVGGEREVTTTDAEGNFTFANVTPANDYTLEVMLKDYATSEAPALPALLIARVTIKQTTSLNRAQTIIFTAVPGTWANVESEPAYQWFRCNSSGGEAEEIEKVGKGSTYQPSEEDVGKTLRVRETVTNAVGSESAMSEPSAVVT